MVAGPMSAIPVFRASLVPMLVVDDERRYRAANRAACLLMRMPEAEIVKLRHDDLIAPERRPAMRERFQRLLDAGTLIGTTDFALPDGTILSVDFGAIARIAPERNLSVFLPAGWDRDAVTRAATPPAHAELTEREHEVLHLVAMGVPVDQIATQLYLSAHTVRTHIRNARIKLGASSRAHAIALAFRAGLLGPIG
jgi:DNA-binding CsgD family transcriptional regulator